MYTSILVALDGSERAEQVLPYARAFSAGSGSPVKLVRVIPPLPPELAANSRAATPAMLTATMRTLAQDYLKGAAEGLIEDGLEVSWLVCEGDPAFAIVDQSEETPDTLVVVGTHGWSGESRWNLGSVTRKVLQAARSPVLVVPARDNRTEIPGPDLDTVIVTLDGSTTSESVLPHAAALANNLRLKIVLLRVAPTLWDYYPYLDHTVLHYGDMSRDLLNRAERYLDEVSVRLQGLGTGDVEPVAVRGNPAEAIIDRAQQHPASLVFMASHGQGSATTYRWLIGSVAQRVAGGSSRPTLIVRGE